MLSAWVVLSSGELWYLILHAKGLGYSVSERALGLFFTVLIMSFGCVGYFIRLEDQECKTCKFY